MDGTTNQHAIGALQSSATWQQLPFAFDGLSDLLVASACLLISLVLIIAGKKAAQQANSYLFFMLASFLFALAINYAAGFLSLWHDVSSLRVVASASAAAMSLALALLCTLFSNHLSQSGTVSAPVLPDRYEGPYLKAAVALERQQDLNVRLTADLQHAELCLVEMRQEVEWLSKVIGDLNRHQRRLIGCDLRKMIGFAEVFEQAMLEQNNEEAAYAKVRLRRIIGEARTALDRSVYDTSIEDSAGMSSQTDLGTALAHVTEFFADRLADQNVELVSDLKVPKIIGDSRVINHVFVIGISGILQASKSEFPRKIAVRSRQEAYRTRITVADVPVFTAPLVEAADKESNSGQAQFREDLKTALQPAISLMGWQCSVSSFENLGTTLTIDIANTSNRDVDAA
ncbi:signal transduction histidine kinase [Roseibium hamelinense]|uniref:Signal transduction histidine kinase n=1 Tax=Roseibium hamelinense TaxID=150831 RepID=A0A562SNN6_9HYPH|nr:HAMP domain-containing histidine kinase [Roseibium hamelinense]MTI44295.1 HAMP domain-containing histidine kinase [Roseibium hamelinense]TWI82929.1 signal transduction histidine kinase [Roseibium hamelinense]